MVLHLIFLVLLGAVAVWLFGLSLLVRDED